MESRRLQGVNLAIDFIEGHLHERLSLDGAAAAAHYSKYHLHRLFTEAAAGALGFSRETGRRYRMAGRAEKAGLCGEGGADRVRLSYTAICTAGGGDRCGRTGK
ncbi:MAG TPA: hypothetical protein IAB61_10590 [Candidatus Merdisoma merdipullorum]|nr:hypothetical protein [Candidatus Merdisoma merdipullorum]